MKDKIGDLSSNGTWVASFIFAGLSFFLIYWSLAFRNSQSIKNLEHLGDLPSFEMVSALTHSKVRKEDLLGKVWIAGFIFTRCMGPCPILTSNMSKLQSDLPNGVRLVTFTVDPDWDKPEVLESYAKRFNVDSSRWLFLTGEKKDVYRLLYEGFKLPILEEPKNPVGFRVTHSTKLVLVDKKGALRGYYSGTDDLLTSHLKDDILKLLNN